MKVTFKTHAGAERTLEVPAGLSLMEVAVTNGVEGIDAICGGNCSCSTCHVLVAPEWIQRLAPASRLESDLLRTVADRQANSRLACQIRLTQLLDGLRVQTPASQER
jgi:2Fe-2S ferredoxin